MAEALEKRVIEILADVTDEPESVFTPEAEIADVIPDSLDVIEGVMEIEETFEIEASDEEWESAKTIADLCALVKSKVEAGHA